MERLVGGSEDVLRVLRIIDAGAQLLHRSVSDTQELLPQAEHHGRTNLVEPGLQVLAEDVGVDYDAQPGLRDAEGRGALPLRPIGVGDEPVGDGLVAESDVLKLDG
jgi:hypothetical protein